MSGSNPFDDLADGEDERERTDENVDADGNASEVPADGDRPVDDEHGEDDGEGNGDDERKDQTRENVGRDIDVRDSGTDGDGYDGNAGSPDGAIDGPTLENSSPPFPYSDAEQKQMYVQDGLWDDFEDRKFDADLELRRTFGVRNVEQREIDTAVVRLVLDRLSAREIAEMVVRTRGFDPAETE